MSTLDERVDEWLVVEGERKGDYLAEADDLIADLYAEVKKLRNDSTTESRNGFKVGDYVRIVLDKSMWEGNRGTVVELRSKDWGSEWVSVKLEGGFSPSHTLPFLPNEIELCF